MIQLDVCRASLNDGMLTHPEAGSRDREEHEGHCSHMWRC